MKLTRKIRLTTALLALVSMLFMQLAVAAYACPNFKMSNESGMMFSQQESMADSMPDCNQSDSKQPALCHAHCQDQQQSLDRTELPPVSPALAIGFFIPITSPDLSLPPSQFLAFPLACTSDPPISIRNCCFRI